ncbi:hypothetical protein ACWPKO_25605 (plasmid) [Coraliomargarita sp. W4R53]
MDTFSGLAILIGVPAVVGLIALWRINHSRRSNRAASHDESAASDDARAASLSAALL